MSYNYHFFVVCYFLYLGGSIKKTMALSSTGVCKIPEVLRKAQPGNPSSGIAAVTKCFSILDRADSFVRSNVASSILGTGDSSTSLLDITKLSALRNLFNSIFDHLVKRTKWNQEANAATAKLHLAARG